jgi:hypothetical protein
MNPERKKNLQKAYRNVTVVVVAFHPFVPLHLQSLEETEKNEKKKSVM